ncbi:MAG: matrixin family metalloprotease [Clostridia bacterium]|nr:matrixin family metalloprotease [Clostridia bacterium]
MSRETANPTSPPERTPRSNLPSARKTANIIAVITASAPARNRVSFFTAGSSSNIANPQDNNYPILYHNKARRSILRGKKTGSPRSFAARRKKICSKKIFSKIIRNSVSAVRIIYGCREVTRKIKDGSSYILSYGGNSDACKNVCTHELGHAVGFFGHSSSSSAVMYYASHDGFTLKTAEKAHLQQIYNNN